MDQQSPAMYSAIDLSSNVNCLTSVSSVMRVPSVRTVCARTHCRAVRIRCIAAPNCNVHIARQNCMEVTVSSTPQAVFTEFIAKRSDLPAAHIAFKLDQKQSSLSLWASLIKHDWYFGISDNIVQWFHLYLCFYLLLSCKSFFITPYGAA